jgi:hypothetical protein
MRHDVWHQQLDAIRCDTIPVANGRQQQAATGDRASSSSKSSKSSILSVETCRLVSCPSFLSPVSRLLLCPVIVCRPYLSCLTVQQQGRNCSFLSRCPPCHAMLCHTMPSMPSTWCQAVGVSASGRASHTSRRRPALEEVNCPSGMVNRADGSRFLPSPPMHMCKSTSTSQRHPTADPKCNVQGALASERYEWQSVRLVSFTPTALRETE